MSNKLICTRSRKKVLPVEYLLDFLPSAGGLFGQWKGWAICIRDQQKEKGSGRELGMRSAGL